jgi:ERCC4-type nuclease
MHTILVDTREQKTPVCFDQYLTDHPKIATELLIFNHVLEVGDVAGSDQIFENKWGNDLESSLKSGHLADQLQRLHVYCQNKGFVGHLLIADRPNCQISLSTFKWAVGIAQQYGIWIHHKKSITDALECIIYYIRNPPKPVLLNLPIIETKKSHLLIRMLAQIEGVLAELAEFLIPESAKRMSDLIDLPIAYWEQRLEKYYKGKKMGALLARIVESL